MNTKLIKNIQEQIKEEMKSPMNKHFDGTPNFNLNVVGEAISEVKSMLSCKKEALKCKRSIVKLLSKHDSKYNLEDHDNEVKLINKELQQLKIINHYNFLINGKYEVLE